MPLTRLTISDFRNIGACQLAPEVLGFNLLYGLNGSGKTSLLEAIYYLSVGRSFRGATTSRVIRQNAEKFLIFAQKQLTYEQSIGVGIEREQAGAVKIRIGGQDAQSIAELADLIPIQLINSQSFNLLDGGPAFRRKYLDWGIFYMNKDFLRTWKNFAQILKQRNAVLRSRRPKKELDIWTQELIVKSMVLDQFRREYVAQLLPLLNATVADLLHLSKLEISYQPGWDESHSYADILAAVFDKDLQAGFTQFGPHRADFKLKINNTSAKDFLSRGQQKLFVCAMILAQGALLGLSTNKKPIYLIDDLPAELDVVSRTSLITLLSKQETQIFVTAVERDALSEMLSGLRLKMFHVEHGSVTEDAKQDARTAEYS
jgi:DNA replication and repair protein RecF